MRRHPLAQMIAIGVVASVVLTVLSLQIDWFPSQAVTAADDIDTLYDVLLICSMPIFVLVMTVAIYSVWKFRAKPGDRSDGAPIHGNTRLEVIWVAIPFVMVTLLAVYSGVVLGDIEEKKPNELRVNVTGRQFTWSFQYPQPGGRPVNSNELVLPVNRPVHFEIEALDVIHSFWVPDFRLKQDAVPGLKQKMRLTPTRLGQYRVVCAELCGIGHATMRQVVRVVPPAEFEAWLDRRRRGGAAAPPGEAGPGTPTPQPSQAGRAVFQANGCGSCHALAKAGSTGQIGPKLDELAAAARRFGARLDETPEQYVKSSIEDPEAFTVPGFPRGTMPSFKGQLTPQELDALVRFLLGPSARSEGK